MNVAIAVPEAVNNREIKEAAKFWHRNGLQPATVVIYLQWIQRFRRYCRERGAEELAELTRTGTQRFADWYARKRRIRQGLARAAARSALYAWSNALFAVGVGVLPWKLISTAPVPRVAIVREFIEYRRRYSGVAASTLMYEQSSSSEFLEFLRQRKRTCRSVRLADIDAFIMKLRGRMNVVAVTRKLCSLRAFLRFLHVSGRLRFDLAASVVGPMLKPDRNPPRALFWPQVRRILRAVDTSTKTGRRDYAILLLMSLYGLGGAEIVGMLLDDIDWERKTISICRPKTQSTILLPLLPAAARALASYLHRSRPSPCFYRHVFIRSKMPFGPFAGSTVIRFILTKYARKAGVTNGCLGSHVLRHSQATRQVELGTPLKIVGDILGHRDPGATSYYIRSARHRLRDLALPLPHD